MVNELDAARIDPLLSWSVSRVVSKTLDYIVNRSESLVRIYRLCYELVELTAVPIACRRLLGYIFDRTSGQWWPIVERERNQLSLPVDFESRILVARFPTQNAGDPQAVDGRKLVRKRVLDMAELASAVGSLASRLTRVSRIPSTMLSKGNSVTLLLACTVLISVNPWIL